MPALFRYVVVALFVAPIWGFVRPANAATITINTVTASTQLHPNNLNPTFISRADCLADSTLTFALVVAGNTLAQNFEVWATPAGNDCRVDANRISPTTAVCGLVFSSADVGSNVPVVPLRDRDILQAALHPTTTQTQGTATPDVCTAPAGTNTQPQGLTIFFMFASNGVADQASITPYDTKFALLGPAAPSNVAAGSGDKLLKLSWTPADVGTVASYIFFCDPKPGTEVSPTTVVVTRPDGGTNPPAGSAGGSGTSSPPAVICPDAQASTPALDEDAGDGGDEGGDAAATSDAACVPSSGAGSTADASTSTTSTSLCSSTELTAGVTPDNTNKLLDLNTCGTSDGSNASSGLIEGLKNNQSYAVSVAAVDGLGNVGALSTLQCATPGPIDDFFTVYQRDGGTAGGSSFCSLAQIGARASRGPLAIVTLFAAALLLGRRARRALRSEKAPPRQSGKTE